MAAIDETNAEGARLLATAAKVLAYVGKADAVEISMGDLAETEKLFAPEHQNGDGVVPAELAGDPRLAGAITRIVDTYGAAEDRSGKPGVDQARVDAFFAAAQEVSDWHAQAEADAATVLPLGDATGAAAAVFEAVREKVEDYFTRCRLAAFDERAAAALNPADTAYAELALQSLDAASAAVAALPLALVGAGRALPLAVGLNPAWEARIAALRDQVVIPILGAREALTQAEWEDLAGRFAAHRAWVAAMPANPVAVCRSPTCVRCSPTAPAPRSPA